MKKYFYIKNVLDFIAALLMVIVLLPLMFVIFLLILIFMGRPIFFVQKRVGFNEIIFKIYKFRTMAVISPEDANLSSDVDRIPTLGRFLRRMSLDELPQLLNILKGDMSFIGPRALLVEYLALYSKEQKIRHAIKPGITGLAQVNGRNAITWNERFLFDLEYVKRFSFLMDCHILVKTIFVVFFQKNVNASQKITMKKFTGKE